MFAFANLSFLFVLIGLAMWLFCPPRYPKAGEVGRVVFTVAMLAWLLQVGNFKL